MKTLTNEEFAARVFDLAKPTEFRPTAYYDRDGDCIEFLARPDNFYAERVDALVTVYISERTGEIVGSLLKGVEGLCKRLSWCMLESNRAKQASPESRWRPRSPNRR